jgi:hypothetical protein
MKGATGNAHHCNHSKPIALWSQTGTDVNVNKVLNASNPENRISRGNVQTLCLRETKASVAQKIVDYGDGNENDYDSNSAMGNANGEQEDDETSFPVLQDEVVAVECTPWEQFFPVFKEGMTVLAANTATPEALQQAHNELVEWVARLKVTASCKAQEGTVSADTTRKRKTHGSKVLL